VFSLLESGAVGSVSSLSLSLAPSLETSTSGQSVVAAAAPSPRGADGGLGRRGGGFFHRPSIWTLRELKAQNRIEISGNTFQSWIS
jgi:hypothetical protein